MIIFLWFWNGFKLNNARTNRSRSIHGWIITYTAAAVVVVVWVIIVGSYTAMIFAGLSSMIAEVIVVVVVVVVVVIPEWWLVTCYATWSPSWRGDRHGSWARRAALAGRPTCLPCYSTARRLLPLYRCFLLTFSTSKWEYGDSMPRIVSYHHTEGKPRLCRPPPRERKNSPVCISFARLDRLGQCKDKSLSFMV